MAWVLSVAMTLATALLGALLIWRHAWLPPAISTIAGPIDRQFAITFIASGLLFYVTAQATIAYLAWMRKSRAQPDEIQIRRGNRALLRVWVLVATVITIVLAVTAYRTGAQVDWAGPAPAALKIEVWGEQFEWYFRYPGPDNRFGPVHFDLMRDSTGNYLGLDPERDPASRDDIVTATLGIPVNQPIELILRSKDVIHSFFVPELRVKEDSVPGMEIHIHFTGTRTGRYQIMCGRLCGLGHYNMHATLVVMTQHQFEAWLQRMAAEQ